MKSKYLGEWWVEKDNTRIHGELSINSNDNFELKLIGRLSGSDNPNLGKYKKYKVIKGFTTCGKKINLFNCNLLNFNISFAGMTTEKYLINTIVIGEHYNSIENIKLKSFTSTFDKLEKWLSESTFKVTFSKNNRKTTIEHELPQSKEYEYGKYLIEFIYSSNYSGDLIKSSEISQIANVKLSSDIDFTIQNAFDKLFEFSKLLSIACMRNINMSNMTAEDILGNKIIIKINNYKNNKINKKNEKILFSFKDIANFSDFLKLWQIKQNSLSPVIDYYIDAHSEKVYTQLSFLKIVQALEAFSRRLRNDSLINNEKHSERIDTILSDISNPKYKKWVEKKLEYSNEPSLSERLKELFHETNFIFELSNRKIKRSIYKIVATRNYYTHFDENKKREILTPDKMYYLGKYLFYILRSLILLELGFSKKYIDKRISKDSLLNIIKKEMEW